MGTNSSPGQRRYLLSDEAFLRREYAVKGDDEIAAFVGVSRSTVRRARATFGIVSRPRGGSERGMTRRLPVRPPRRSAAMQIADRIAEESAGDVPATFGLIAARVRALSEANAAHDLAAMKDALVSLASASGLVLDHLQALENAG